MNIKFFNKFHNTETVVRLPKENIKVEIDDTLTIKMSPSHKKNVEKKLCGIHDCTCNPICGARIDGENFYSLNFVY